MQKDFDQDFPSEAELEEGLEGLTDPGIGTSVCPTPAVLRDFVAGKYVKDEVATGKVLVHLADCKNCENVLSQIRAELLSGSKTPAKSSFVRHLLSWKFAFGLFGAAVLMITWFLATRDRDLKVAILDLQHITRGVESSPAPFPLTLYRKAAQVRILLPTGSVAGTYEVGLFQSKSATPLLNGFAETVSEANGLVINIPLSRSDMPPGPYFLGIRPMDSEWVYYPIRLQ